MASEELSRNAVLTALRPGSATVPVLQALQPYDGLLVPSCSVLEQQRIEERHLTSEFLQHHIVRFAGDAARRTKFTTAAGIVGVFRDDGKTVTVGSQTVAILRRLSSDMLATALSPPEDLDTAPTAPARRSSSSLLRRNSSINRPPPPQTGHIPDVYVIDQSLFPLDDLHVSVRSSALAVPDGSSSVHGGGGANRSRTESLASTQNRTPVVPTSTAQKKSQKVDTSFSGFQQRLLNDARLRPLSKRMKTFLVRCTDAGKKAAAPSQSEQAADAAGTAAHAVPQEEVRNFIATAASDACEFWDMWSPEPPKDDEEHTPKWVVEVREHVERYVTIKLYDVLLRPDPLDADFLAKRDVVLAAASSSTAGGTGGLPSTDAIIAALPESQARTWRKAVDSLEECTRVKAPADKAQLLERTVGLVKQCLSHAALRSSSMAAGAATPAEASRTAVQQHLNSALRLCVLHQQTTNLAAHLGLVEGCRNLAALSTGDLRGTIGLVREALQFWVSAEPSAGENELRTLRALLTNVDAAASAGDAATKRAGSATPASAAGRSPTDSRAASAAPSAEAASPQTEARRHLTDLMQRLNEAFDTAAEMPEGMPGALPIDRIDVVTEQDLQTRREWDEGHALAAEKSAEQWTDELARRREAEDDIATAESKWQDVRRDVASAAEVKAAELDALDESRLALWEAHLIKMSELTDEALVSAKTAWTKHASEVERNLAATHEHMQAASEHLEGERAEVDRRADAATESARDIARRLTELHAGLDECLKSFHLSRAHHDRMTDEQQEQQVQILAEGLHAQRQQQEDLDARERALDQRRVLMESWMQRRDEELTAREEHLQEQQRERETALEEMRRALLSSVELRETEVARRHADLDEREQRLELRMEAAKNDLAAREEELRLRQSAYDAHSVELRAALAAETRAVEQRVRTSEASSKDAREVAQKRLAETKRAAVAAEAALKDRSVVLDRRQAEMDRRQRVSSIAEERSQQTIEQRTKEILRRADADRHAVADIEANLKRRQQQLEDDEAALHQQQSELEGRAAAREEAAQARVSEMLQHCRGEFETALQTLHETDAVEHVDDFKSLALKDFEGLWSTMVAFRRVKKRFGEVVRAMEEKDKQLARDVEASKSTPPAA